MIAEVYCEPWKRHVPSMIAIGSTRLDTVRLRGLVEFWLLPNRCQMRVVGNGCEASLVLPAKVANPIRFVVSDVPVSMITRAAEADIQISIKDNRVVFHAAGVEISSALAPDVEFPPEKVAKDRAVSLDSRDVIAWAVADEPATTAQADDTIWLGVTPQNKRLYASASSSSWSAMVRDGQDLQSVPVSATIMRKIKPTAGDCIGFCPDGITVRRGMLNYAVGALATRKLDAYPILGNVLNRQAGLIHLNEGQLSRMIAALRVINMGSELSELIPVLVTYQDGVLYLGSESSTITGVSCVEVKHISGLRNWSIGIAGESLLATLLNFKSQIGIGVTDNPETGAMLVWSGNVVSARASLKVHHHLLPQDYRHLEAALDRTPQAQSSPEEEMEEPGTPHPHPAETEMLEP